MHLGPSDFPTEREDMNNANGTQASRPGQGMAGSVKQRVAARLATVPVHNLPQTPPSRLEGTWRQARPARIDRALAHAQGRDPGGWLAAGATRELRDDQSLVRTVAGAEVVFWRGRGGALMAGPGACPHLGAQLSDCDVVDGTLLCRWHGLALTGEKRAGWSPFPALDDGALLWVRLPLPGESPVALPTIAERPPLGESLVSVISRQTACEPRDIIANRLDPWHGAWLHPYAFSDLTVDEEASSAEVLVLNVAYRLGRKWAVPVRAEFRCPDARTICMTITDGEGIGSVVETHATPVTAPGVHPAVTVMTELVVAYSDRPGFAVARRLAPLVTAGMRRSAWRLWDDDLLYAERLYTLRRRAEAAAPAAASPAPAQAAPAQAALAPAPSPSGNGGVTERQRARN
jgi:hypothetical protein